MNPDPIPFPSVSSQHALAPLVESAHQPVSDGDLIQLADRLAGEFKYDAWSAGLGEARWYQNRAEAGGQVCTLNRAMLLRRMTIQRCVVRSATSSHPYFEPDGTLHLARARSGYAREFDERLGHGVDDPQPPRAPVTFSTMPNRLVVTEKEYQRGRRWGYGLAFGAGVATTLLALAALAVLG